MYLCLALHVWDNSNMQWSLNIDKNHENKGQLFQYNFVYDNI